MAKAPPFPGPNGEGWLCPAHTEHLLLGTDPVARHYARVATRQGGPRVTKIRRPKNAKIVDVGLRRGVENFGVIEVDDDLPEAAAEEDAVIYRLSARGIVDDFSVKCRK